MASSSSVIFQAKYDVFLSFRGEDTRDNFISHLYAALCRKQVQTFIDDDRLKRGDNIPSALLEAIENSKISVIIFSKDYASSGWCLDELAKILECMEMNGQMVIPVFYRINRSDIREQSPSFADAFVKHKERFKGMAEKIQKWRDALTTAADLSGWDSMEIRPESKLVDEIVRDIMKKLNDLSPSSDCEGLVGIDSQIEHIKSLLSVGLSDFRVIGIWGMGGIGKTTIAEVVFNQISSKFEGSCFIANVREESEKYGLVHLKEQLLSKILDERSLNIPTLNTVPISIKRRVQRKKVLIVLDDVNAFEQLEILSGGLVGFGLGSRVIITARDKQVLCAYGVESIYQVQELNKQHAFQLFCNYAFNQNPPLEDFALLSKSIIGYAKGNPLALKVLGSSLYRKSKQEWESALHKLRNISNPKIYNILITSYQGLDFEEKNIFLDIACFFKLWDIDHVTKILHSCYTSFHPGLNVLIDKSLISITKSNHVHMHDLLQEMGWEIVHQESPKAPERRSRVWRHVDAIQVLRNNTGTNAIEGLFLDISKTKDVHLSSEVFKNMPNLKFLNFYVPCMEYENISRVHLPQGLKYLPNELRYLHWHRYPLKALPSNFSPQNLVELSLPFGNYDPLSVEPKHCSNSKFIYLNHLNAPQLGHWKSLLAVSSSTQYLTNLHILSLRGCKTVRSFPSNLHFKSPINLNLSSCINLREFPQISGNVEELNLSMTSIKELPSWMEHLNGLRVLALSFCENLVTLPSTICNLTSIINIDVYGCSKLDKLPENLGNIIHLKRLYARSTAISQLPASVIHWREITNIDLAFCSLTELPEDIGYLSSLEMLHLRGNNFQNLPTNIKQLSQLKWLDLSDCEMLQSIPELPLGLEYLDASNCKQLQSLPTPPSSVQKLDQFKMEKLFEYINYNASRKIKFIFTNCFNLSKRGCNNVLADLQHTVQHMATAALRLCYQKVFDGICPISLCLPGSEIPDWFSYQSTGSCLTIELPQYWCNRRFIGFALSAAIEFEMSSYLFKVKCNQPFQTDYEGNRFEWVCFVSNDGELIESDHIILGYSAMDVRLLKGDYTTLTFEFSSSDCKVKRCGIHPLYSPSSVVESFAYTNEDLAEAMLEDSTKRKFYCANTSGKSNGEEVEPQSKRTCGSQVNAL